MVFKLPGAAEQRWQPVSGPTWSPLMGAEGGFEKGRDPQDGPATRRRRVAGPGHSKPMLRPASHRRPQRFQRTRGWSGRASGSRNSGTPSRSRRPTPARGCHSSGTPPRSAPLYSPPIRPRPFLAGRQGFLRGPSHRGGLLLRAAHTSDLPITAKGTSGLQSRGHAGTVISVTPWRPCTPCRPLPARDCTTWPGVDWLL
jgi:hypothetical protein